MAKKSKEQGKTYVIAIKDYDKTEEAIKSGEIKMAYENDRYMDFFKPDFLKVKEMPQLKKFIKKTGQKKAEVQHYWSGLIDQNYTLAQITYTKEENEFRKLCDGEYIKYLHGLK
jgi:hypothetical protein